MTKHSIIMETRLDIDDVIKALSFIKSETGLTPRSRGEFLRMCVQGIASLNTKEVIELNKTTDEKLHLLHQTFGGVVNLGKSRHGRIQINPSISRNLQEMAVESDFKDPISIEEKIKSFIDERRKK